VTQLLVGLILGALAGGLAVWVLTSRRSGTRPASDALSLSQPVSARAELVSKISHELKNPIMGVKGLASTGSRLYDSLSDAERRDLFGMIDAEAARLKLIAEETSTTLKIDAGTLAYDRQREDVGRLVEETAWRTPVGDHPVRVTAQAELAADVDRTRLAEALTNLIDNAARYSPAGTPIEVRAAAHEGGIRIEVADGGPGIPDERKASVFDRYGSWRPAGYEEVPGAGLGLYIARAHVTAHGGRLDIVDAEPGGTILRVWLPSGG
jgi:two-component system, OmpR family, sensor histidine kinase KdpD